MQARNKEEGGWGGVGWGGRAEGLRRFSRRVKVKEWNKYPDLNRLKLVGKKRIVREKEVRVTFYLR